MQAPHGDVVCGGARHGAICECAGLPDRGEYYPYHGCTQFVRCSEGLGLASVLLDCAPGTLWDADAGTCRWDCAVAAGLSPSPPCTSCVFSYPLAP